MRATNITDYLVTIYFAHNAWNRQAWRWDAKIDRLKEALPKRATKSVRRSEPRAFMTTFQEMIFGLQQFWSTKGCAILQPYDVEMGAGTFHPETVFRALGSEPFYGAFVQPSRRPGDGRYGDNPNRVSKFHQFQVIYKPSPANAQEITLDSLKAVGLDPTLHDMRFVEDNWESPTLGAAGLGWELWCDGMEILQFTYFLIDLKSRKPMRSVLNIPTTIWMVRIIYTNNLAQFYFRA